MSDLIIPDPAPEPVGPAPVEPTEDITHLGTALQAERDPEPEPEPDMFPRSYVEELRQESAKYRTRAKSYDDAFDGMDDDTREAWLEYTALVVRAQRGDQEAVARINEMFADDDEPEPVAPQQQVDYAALAREEARRAAEEVYAERENARVQQEQIAAVRSAGESLGYKFGTDDYILFVRGANEAAQAGDEDPISAGDRAVKAYHQAIVDQYLASKGQQADTSPAIPSAGATTPDLSTRPYSDDMSEAQKFARVRDSALARMTQGRQ